MQGGVDSSSYGQFIPRVITVFSSGGAAAGLGCGGADVQVAVVGNVHTHMLVHGRSVDSGHRKSPCFVKVLTPLSLWARCYPQTLNNANILAYLKFLSSIFKETKYDLCKGFLQRPKAAAAFTPYEGFHSHEKYSPEE